MYTPQFAHIRAWVFDLDNTLYPPGADLFDQIEAQMNAFIVNELRITAEEAAVLRTRYWRDHGTTLAGLMAHHDMAPEVFMEVVHDIDHSALIPDPVLRARIVALPGRKIIYTNGSRKHAERVTAARGLDGIFDAIYGVEHAGYVPKPNPDAFARIFAADGLSPATAAMFEDDPRNLAVPHDLGMRTVLVGPKVPDAPHIHHQTEDLSDFLSRVV
jgi:putative hydrolase of the HAD superfamily